jgi:hypothetical protein
MGPMSLPQRVVTIGFVGWIERSIYEIGVLNNAS